MWKFIDWRIRRETIVDHCVRSFVIEIEGCGAPSHKGDDEENFIQRAGKTVATPERFEHAG